MNQMEKELCTELKRIRNKEGYTQEAWAERIHVSTKSVQNYESGLSFPAEGTIKRIVDITGEHTLVKAFMNAKSELYREYLSGISCADLPMATLGTLNKAGELLGLQKKIIEIACDGIVDNSERQMADELRNIIHQLQAQLDHLDLALS